MPAPKHLLTGLFLEQFMFIFEGKVEDIHAAHYTDIPEDTFRQIVLADPTTLTDPQGLPKKMGNYCKWLLALYSKNALKLEDLYKATDYLQVFTKNIAALPMQSRNIASIKTLPELFVLIEPYIGKKSKGETEREIKSEGADKVYQDGKWTIIRLKTEEAAKYYGKGTQWCTAGDEDNRFDDYSSQGDIFVVMDRPGNRKYQIHFATAQFMDETDSPIDPQALFPPSVIEFFNKEEGFTEQNESDLRNARAGYELITTDKDSDIYNYKTGELVYISALDGAQTPFHIGWFLNFSGAREKYPDLYASVNSNFRLLENIINKYFGIKGGRMSSPSDTSGVMNLSSGVVRPFATVASKGNFYEVIPNGIMANRGSSQFGYVTAALKKYIVFLETTNNAFENAKGSGKLRLSRQFSANLVEIDDRIKILDIFLKVLPQYTKRVQASDETERGKIASNQNGASQLRRLAYKRKGTTIGGDFQDMSAKATQKSKEMRQDNKTQLPESTR